MPYPNESSCRLRPPDSSAKTARKNGAAKIAGKPVDHIYQIVGGKSHLQAVRFPRDNGWGTTAATKQAREWCSGEGGTFEPMKAEQGHDEAKPEGTKVQDMDTPADGALEEPEALGSALLDCSDLDECEVLRDRIADLISGGRDDLSGLLAEADSKWESLAQVGRVPLCDSFASPVEILDAGDGSKVIVRAVVGQVDTKNNQGRIYPRSEIVDAIVRGNRLAKRGKLLGLDGHPGAAGISRTPAARDVSLRWDKVMLKDTDLHAEGELVPTEAGKSFAACWKSGVVLEWSKRGYGRQEHFDTMGQVLQDAEAVKAAKASGSFSHTVVHDYIMRGIDVVTDGADLTHTVSLVVENAETQDGSVETQEGAEMPEEKTEKTETVDTTAENVVSQTTKIEAPKIDMDAIVAEVTQRITDGVTPAVVDAATAATQKAVDEALARKALADHKAALLAGVTDEALRIPVERNLAMATSIEDADARLAEFKPYIERTLNPTSPYNGIAQVTDQRHEKQREDQWWLGGEIKDRPDSAEGVRQAIIDSYPGNGRFGLDNPRNAFEEMVNTMWDLRDTRRYFDLATKPGIRQLALLDAATTTTAMGTLTPLVLPMMRDLYPKLIPFELFSVQPLSQPSGTINSLAIITGVEEYNLSESSHFDSTKADHTEAASKTQIKPRITQTTVTARTKSIRYHLTQELRQDLRNVHGLDADGEMIRAATEQIAREINLTFLGNVLNGATAGSQIWGTVKPDSSWNGKEWNDRLAIFITKCKSFVSQKVYIAPDWVVYGPGIAPYLEAMGTFAAIEGQRITFGNGLTRVGTIGSGITCYECEWFASISAGNKALFGFRPPTWMETGAVYAPYIPLYISPEDYHAETNDYERSVSTRFADVITNGDCFSVLTANEYTGSDITTVV